MDYHTKRAQMDKQIERAMKNYPLTHPNGQLDMRYTLALEYCGHAEKRIVLRYCTDFIDSFRDARSATLRAVGHRAVLNGAPIFTNQA